MPGHWRARYSAIYVIYAKIDRTILFKNVQSIWRLAGQIILFGRPDAARGPLFGKPGCRQLNHNRSEWVLNSVAKGGHSGAVPSKFLRPEKFVSNK